MIHITKIYLVTNCYGDPNKVYIGKTINCRKREHIKTYSNNIEYSYIDETPSLKREYWEPLESYWIEQFIHWGFDVQNKNKGGGGCEFQSQDTKNKMRVIKKGVPLSEEHKLSISISRKGLKHSKIHSNLGIPRTQETKEKLSKPRTQETKDKMKKPKPPGFGNMISILLKNRDISSLIIYLKSDIFIFLIYV